MKYSLARLRQIPILDVAHALGMELTRTSTDTYNMREGRHVTSLTIFLKTNTFYRFSGKETSGVHGGSVIDLVMHLRECSFKEAVAFLSTRFR